MSKKGMLYGGTHQFGQKCIHQASTAVNSRFEPYDAGASEKSLGMGADDIEVGMLTFCRTRTRIVAPSAKKRHRSAEYAMPVSSTRRQQGVFANLKHVPSRESIHFAGVAENEITVRGDHWRYANGTAITVVLGGTVTIMNTGPHDIYEGEWVYWDLPKEQFPTDAAGEVCHRAVVMPITKENVMKDPGAIYRTIGKCLMFSQAGSMLDLSVSTATAPIPFGIDFSLFVKDLSQLLGDQAKSILTEEDEKTKAVFPAPGIAAVPPDAKRATAADNRLPPTVPAASAPQQPGGTGSTQPLTANSAARGDMSRKRTAVDELIAEQDDEDDDDDALV